MVPSTFVVMKALPMTPNGKIDRNALVAPAEIGDEEEGPTASNATPIEEMLAGMYADALGVARVGLQRSFFDLGGHSLMATRLLSRVREAFQVEIPLRGLFESPTVAGLAAVIEREIKAGHGAVLPPIERAPRDSDLPMSFAQQRLWFLNQLEPDVPIYNNPAFVRLVGNLNVTALHHTFTEIVRRHEALRTVFALKAGVPVQIIRPARPARIPLLDLSGLAPAQRETEVARLLPELGGTRFDLARGPLLQTALVRLADDDHLISVVMHHIITDGWSTGIFIRELAALYEAFAAGRPSPLTELDRQYADYAYWQRQWLQGDVLAAQLAYWERHLKGAPPLLEVPTDRPRPPLRSLAGEQQMIVIEAEIYDALRALSRQEGATLFMTMLAAFQVLLYRHTGQDDICTGTPIAGRNRIETEGLIGFFVNTLVLRTDLSGDPTFKELIARVREATLGALAHQDLPFEKIVEHLQPARSASYTPLFQVMFAVENVPEASIEVPGLTMTPMTGERLTSKFDMSFYIHETGSEILGVFEYSKDLYDAATIARLLAQYKTLLANIIAAPCGRLSELSVAAAADRHHAMAEFNQDLPAFEVTF
jgi:acyl carrier protein